MISQRLRIESVNGSPINDYRIESGHVEVRTLDPSGRYYPSPNSHWRPLDASDIQLHRALRTVVAKWLQVKLNTGRVEQDKIEAREQCGL